MNLVLRQLGSRVWIAIVVVVLLFVVLAVYQITHGAPVCAAPSVPLRELTPELNANGCATIGQEKPMHGIWVDSKEGPLFFPDRTDITPGEIRRADAWLMMDDSIRAQVAHALPQTDGTVTAQILAVSFIGTDYVLDRAVRGGLRRLYDMRELRSLRLLRREYGSARAGPKPVHTVVRGHV